MLTDINHPHSLFVAVWYMLSAHSDAYAISKSHCLLEYIVRYDNVRFDIVIHYNTIKSNWSLILLWFDRRAWLANLFGPIIHDLDFGPHHLAQNESLHLGLLSGDNLYFVKQKTLSVTLGKLHKRLARDLKTLSKF